MNSAKRFASLGYAVVAYGAFLLSSAWSVGFLAGHGAPTSVDGPATRPAWASLAIDGALLLAFAVQHTVMARAGFKRLLTRVIPAPLERSTFVLAASLLLFAMVGWWQPVPTVVWHVGLPWSAAIWTVYAVGWSTVVASTYMVDHADFVGLKQAYHGQHYRAPGFMQRALYKWCRHPMMLGLVIAFWATPHLTTGHLFFAVSSTAYIALGVRFEERALRAELGAEYEEYASRVPALVPSPRTLRVRSLTRAAAAEAGHPDA
jgi:protein-S-isoprenylcysteine O-methyltransferase Ste14